MTSLIQDFEHDKEFKDLNDKEVHDKYEHKRLKIIRENWKALILFFQVLTVIVIIGCGIDEQSSTLFIIRTSLLILFSIFLIFFLRIIKKYNWAAKNSGIIFIIILVVANTEVNVNLSQYRVYEGFIAQIAISFALSICVSVNWVVNALVIALCYGYYFTRLYLVFDNISHSLKISLCEVVIFYALAAYLNSRTLQREFCANHKAEESSKDFKQFLKSLPEGVCIIDDDDSQFKFYNLKLRQTLDTSLFCKAERNLKALEEVQKRIEKDFKDSQKHIKSFDETLANNSAFRQLSKDFKVLKPEDKINLAMNPEKISNFLKKSMQDYQTDSKNPPFLVKKNKIGGQNDITLHEFLEQERMELQRENGEEREIKITLYFDQFNYIDDIKAIGREFIIKTRRVSRNDPDNPKTSLYLHIFIDTTQIRQLEEQRAQSKYQKQMLANVSHEFRTPLNAMSMSLMFLKDQVQGPPSKFLRIASTSCDILKHLVEDILDHAKIESGVFEIQEEVFKTNKLLDEVKDIFELQASQKKIKLIFLISEELENTRIKTDKQRIKQVLLNLVSNALKFTDRGSISISLKKVHKRREILEGREEDKEECKYDTYFNFQNGSVNNRMDSRYEYVNQEYTSRPQLPRVNKYSGYPNSNNVSNSEESDNEGIEPYRSLKLMLSVEDTGIGIPLSDQSSLFKLFGKTSSNHNRNKTGCGLGLTICRKILKKLGGDITLESEEGKGTKFTCIFECKY